MFTEISKSADALISDIFDGIIVITKHASKKQGGICFEKINRYNCRFVDTAVCNCMHKWRAVAFGN